MDLVYVVGPPGAGKSTLMAELTRGLLRHPVDRGVPHDVLFRGQDQVAAELGRQRGAFSGTDALSMSIHPAACGWITAATYPLVLAEGARLGTRLFLATAVGAGYQVHVIHLDPAEDLASARRATRGTSQDPQWVRGATTRATRLAQSARDAGYHVHTDPADLQASELATRITAACEPLGRLCSANT